MPAKTEDDILDELFGALSDRSRRKMLLTLTLGERSVSGLGAPLGLSKQLVSKHLGVLERAGLIVKQKDGRVQRCHFNPQTFARIQSVIDEYQRFWNRRLDALETYIDQIHREKGGEKKGEKSD